MMRQRGSVGVIKLQLDAMEKHQPFSM